MHPQETLRRGLVAGVFVFLLAASAAAQYGNSDQGQYQILQARYGTEERNVDVTPRLKELARADVTFRMGNSTFGEDPDPGRVKALRIYTRGPNGQNRVAGAMATTDNIRFSPLVTVLPTGTWMSRTGSKSWPAAT